jgi:hypothetical protein
MVQAVEETANHPIDEDDDFFNPLPDFVPNLGIKWQPE